MNSAGACHRRIVRVVCYVSFAILSACTPELNWRAVQIDRLSALLPCKPDRAIRSVLLGDHPVKMEMAGCEASGALVAISHVRLEDGQKAGDAVSAWRSSALNNMRSSVVKDLPVRPGVTVFLQAAGVNVHGETVQAHLAWLAKGTDIYHVATYSKEVNGQIVETLFTELKLQ